MDVELERERPNNFWVPVETPKSIHRRSSRLSWDSNTSSSSVEVERERQRPQVTRRQSLREVERSRDVAPRLYQVYIYWTNSIYNRCIVAY